MNIKEEINALYKIIEVAEKQLSFLRGQCTHEKKYYGNYMWAPGHINAGFICEDCGTFLTDEVDKKALIQEYNKLISSELFTNSDIYSEVKDKLRNYSQMSKVIASCIMDITDKQVEHTDYEEHLFKLNTLLYELRES